MLTETVELGVLVPYPEEGREANDQRRPSVLSQKRRLKHNFAVCSSKFKFEKKIFDKRKREKCLVSMCVF